MKAAYEKVAEYKYVLPPLNDVGQLTPEEQKALDEQLLNSARRRPRTRHSSNEESSKLRSRSPASSEGIHLSSTPPHSDVVETEEIEASAPVSTEGAVTAVEDLVINTIVIHEKRDPVAAPSSPNDNRGRQNSTDIQTPNAPPSSHTSARDSAKRLEGGQPLLTISEDGPTLEHSPRDSPHDSPHDSLIMAWPRATTTPTPLAESFRSPSQTSNRVRLFSSQLSLWTSRTSGDLKGSQPPTPSGEQLRLRPPVTKAGDRHRRHVPFMSWSAGV